MQGGNHLIPAAGGEFLTFGEVGIAGFGGDGEERRNGQADARHLGEVGAFATQQAAQCVQRVVDIGLSLVEFIKQIDPFFGHYELLKRKELNPVRGVRLVEKHTNHKFYHKSYRVLEVKGEFYIWYHLWFNDWCRKQLSARWATC